MHFSLPLQNFLYMKNDVQKIQKKKKLYWSKFTSAAYI